MAYGAEHFRVVSKEAEIVQEFFKKQDVTYMWRPFTVGTEYTSHGSLSIVVAPSNDQRKKMRRVVASEVSNPYRLCWLLEKRFKEVDNFVCFVHNQCISGAVVDVRVVVRQYCGKVIRKMMFKKIYFGEGKKDGGAGVKEEEDINSPFTMLSVMYAFCLFDYMPSLRRSDLNGHEQIMKEAIKIVNKCHDPIIDERVRAWREGKKKEAEDLLAILLSIKDSKGKPFLSAEEIKAQAAV
ncbi:hypothetical protein NE237_026306 [Protea cynaroides]|uniref:Uncharacterized protein n=1 Tax=Protea cynaroides TaxID=273540 RepID=A0A9Q0K259_9MAGN|nr:hypothetical protein NE237_026306 [Protea cynaroides]